MVSRYSCVENRALPVMSQVVILIVVTLASYYYIPRQGSNPPRVFIHENCPRKWNHPTQWFQGQHYCYKRMALMNCLNWLRMRHHLQVRFCLYKMIFQWSFYAMLIPQYISVKWVLCLLRTTIPLTYKRFVDTICLLAKWHNRGWGVGEKGSHRDTIISHRGMC